MSRASALAYIVEEGFDLEPRATPPPPANTSLYRLLGVDDTAQVAQVAQFHPKAAPKRPAWEQVWPEPPLVAITQPYYAQVYAQPQTAPIAVTTRRSFGPILAKGAAGLALVLMALMVVPALARGGSTVGRLSSYRDVAVGSVSGVGVQAVAPVIDVTSSAPAPANLLPAAPAPAPAPAPKPAPSGGAYSVLGPPTISVRQIEAVLADYGSPAAGMGQKMYDLGVKYGVNPAYALAFFVHESGCGTKGVARTTKSIGNIRWTEGFDNFEGYRSYPSWEAGVEDWYGLIKNLYVDGWGLHTVDAIIPVYAPSADRNDPPAYIAAVKWLVDSWRGK